MKMIKLPLNVISPFYCMNRQRKLILHDQYKRSAQEVDAKSNFLRYFFI